MERTDYSSAPRRIVNPVTGDRIEFVNSPLLGDDGPLEFRCELAPAAKGSPLHVHRTLRETFTVVSGVLVMDLGGANLRQLRVGERIEIAPGEAHGFRNALEEPTIFDASVSPGGGFEKFLRITYGLAADGATGADGAPRDPLALALVLQYADLTLHGAPAGIQAAAIAAFAWLGRKVGVEDRFSPFLPAARLEPARVAI